ncbi:MAG: PAS domain-containing sensor histidine kinase [Bdellovibrionota bacterium]|nr:PAS domain-containing sensor histidine kinase [Bdellovibrionota bacterium]
MDKMEVRLSQGSIQASYLEEAVAKLRFSLFNLFCLVPIYYSLGGFDPFLKIGYLIGLPFMLFTAIRFFDAFRFAKHTDEDSLNRHWKSITTLSLLSNVWLGIIHGLILYHNEVFPQAFYIGLAVTANLVGGTQQYFYDKKLYDKFTITVIVIPLTMYLTKGYHGYVVAAIIAYFSIFVRTATVIQNRFFWRYQEESAFNHSVVKSLPSPMAIFNKELEFVAVNPSLAKVFNVRIRDLEGKSISKFVRKESNNEIFSFLKSFYDIPNKQSAERELTVNNNGIIRHLFMVATRMKSSPHLLTLALDLTDLKAAEKELEQQKAMNLEASKLSSIGEMANAMAHEINNPLSIILGKTEQAKRVIDMDEPKLDYVKRSLEVITSNVSRISTIILGLRTISGGMNDEFYDAKTSDVAEKINLLTKEKILSNGVQLEINEVPDCIFYGNTAQITHVLMHLLNNSQEAVAKHEKPWIKVDFSQTESDVVIEVSDSGPGIPVEIAEKIFNPFYTTKDIGKGMGLGLSVSKGIIDSHKGQFFVDNACENTKFVIKLPKLIARAA